MSFILEICLPFCQKTINVKKMFFSLKFCYLFICIAWRLNLKNMSTICKVSAPVSFHSSNVKKISFLSKIFPPVCFHTINVKKMSFICKDSPPVCFHTINVRCAYSVKFLHMFICIPWRLNVKKMSVI